MIPDTGIDRPNPLTTEEIAQMTQAAEGLVEAWITQHNRAAGMGDAQAVTDCQKSLEDLAWVLYRLRLEGFRIRCKPTAAYPVRIGIGDNLSALYPEASRGN